ncbi:MAG: hypothetical protein ACE5DM_02135 [Candidatus Nanoarchaeia archaeon]
MRGTDVSKLKRMYRTAKDAAAPDTLTIRLALEDELRYGENPNQPAGRYGTDLSSARDLALDIVESGAFGFKGEDVIGRIENMLLYLGFPADSGISLAKLTNIQTVKSGKGGLSATNMMDITRAMDMLKFFSDPTAAVMKHTVPSGFATQHKRNSLDQIYVLARDVDARSAFGSVVVVNRPLDLATAEAIMSTYVEVVGAQSYEEGTMDVLGRKKDIRAVTFDNLDKMPKFAGDDICGLYDVKMLPTGRVIVQRPYLTSIKGPEDLVFDALVKKKDEEDVCIARDPTDRELRDMLTAWYVNLGVRSNGIVFVKDGVTVAVGSGQQERVGAVEQAMTKAYQKAWDRAGIEYDSLDGAASRERLAEKEGIRPLHESVVSSDAFFPFRDSVDLIAGEGVSAVIQPGGSRNDYEVVQACNDHDMAMALTSERCFGHF